jgi:hypothetical protein
METPVTAASVPSFRSEADLFSAPPLDISLLSSEYNSYFPLSSTKDNENPLEFHVPGNSIHYLDHGSTFLYVRAKVVNTGWRET